MKFQLSLGVVLASTTIVSAVDLPKARVTIQPGDQINSGEFNGTPRYLTWMADSQIKRGVEPTFAYTISAFYSGILLAYERTGDTKYLNYVKHQIDIILYPDWNGNILLYNNSRSLDDIRMGHSFLDMYNITGNPIYLTAAKTLRDQINHMPRTPRGGFYHRYPTYVDQMWLDGIYMADVFYARWTREIDPTNSTAWNDIALQFDLIDAGTTSHRNRTNGLPLHGFDESKTALWADPETGASPHVWARAVGWYIMALVDVLDFFPQDHPARPRLLRYLRSVADAIVAAQDATTKGWWLVMDPGYEGRPGNYIESSGTSMFVYGLLKAIRLGYLEDDSKYRRSALEAFHLMTETFTTRSPIDNILDMDWTVQTGSLSSNGTFDYYASMSLFRNDLKGVASFIFASYEYELMH